MLIVDPVKAAIDQLNQPSVGQTLLAFAGKTSAPAAGALAEEAGKGDEDRNFSQ